MRYAYQPSFLETSRNLFGVQMAKLLKAIEKFQHAMESQQWPQGLAITHLRAEYFEFRVDIHLRVVYHRSSDPFTDQEWAKTERLTSQAPAAAFENAGESVRYLKRHLKQT